MEAIKILYEGKTLANLSEAEAAILHCNDKRMRTNVRAVCNIESLIQYGEIQTVVQEGETAILWCKNKRAKHDILIQVFNLAEFESNFWVLKENSTTEYEYFVTSDDEIFLANFVE